MYRGVGRHPKTILGQWAARIRVGTMPTRYYISIRNLGWHPMQGMSHVKTRAWRIGAGDDPTKHDTPRSNAFERLQHHIKLSRQHAHDFITYADGGLSVGSGFPHFSVAHLHYSRSKTHFGTARGSTPGPPTSIYVSPHVSLQSWDSKRLGL